MKKWLARILLVVLALMMVLAAAAGAEGERIVRFRSDVHVTMQNIATVSETIVYDFGSLQRHGIFRTVPVEYRPAADVTYYLDFKLVGVTDGSGKSVPVKEESSGSAAVLRIGDPDKTITGQQTYKITYQLTPLVDAKGGQDHIALNLTGNQWEVPIDEAEAVITFDNAAAVTGAVCYAGAFGSTDTAGCAVEAGSTSTIVKSSKTLGPGEGLTFEAFLPKGFVTFYLQPNVPVPMTLTEKIALAATVLFTALVVGGISTILALRYLRERRRKKDQTIVAQYEPPKDLTPAHIGLLHDNKSSMVEITATLIDLAVRGHLRIEQTQAKRWLLPARYRLTRLTPAQPDTKLHDYEIELMEELFRKGDVIKLDDVDKAGMAKTVQGIHKKLKDALKNKGFYGRISTEPGIIEKALDAGNISDAGAKKWADVKGFELYLTVAEKDRLNFTDAPEKTPKLFNALLPYAIALGVERQWAKQFEGMDLAQDSNWYAGPAGIHYGALALTNDLSSSFSSTISSSFTAPSSGGGGGFSGGGFGGGGGGSW